MTCRNVSLLQRRHCKVVVVVNVLRKVSINILEKTNVHGGTSFNGCETALLPRHCM
jgi:hypothetical protein